MWHKIIKGNVVAQRGIVVQIHIKKVAQYGKCATNSQKYILIR